MSLAFLQKVVHGTTMRCRVQQLARIRIIELNSLVALGCLGNFDKVCLHFKISRVLCHPVKIKKWGVETNDNDWCELGRRYRGRRRSRTILLVAAQEEGSKNHTYQHSGD